jgi:hypothetical protein
MDGWEIARNIAILILVIQALALFLAIFIGGVMGSIAIIETTLSIRKMLNRIAHSAERVHDTTDTLARTYVLEPTTEFERVRAKIHTYVRQLRHTQRDAGNGADSSTEA